MKKEVLIAIIIGFTLGLIITFGVYTAQKSLSSDLQPTNNLNPSSPPLSPTTPASQNITISSPENGALVTNEKLTITGNTSPNILLAVISLDDATTATSDNQGNFSSELTLKEGTNQITIETYDPFGNQSSKKLTVIYLPNSNPIELSPTPTPKS